MFGRNSAAAVSRWRHRGFNGDFDRGFGCRSRGVVCRWCFHRIGRHHFLRYFLLVRSGFLRHKQRPFGATGGKQCHSGGGRCEAYEFAHAAKYSQIAMNEQRHFLRVLIKCVYYLESQKRERGTGMEVGRRRRNMRQESVIPCSLLPVPRFAWAAPDAAITRQPQSPCRRSVSPPSTTDAKRPTT